MKTLEDYATEFRNVITEKDLGGKTVRMDIDGIGCIHISGTTVSTEKNSADCVLTTSHAVYDKLYFGTIDPTIAFGTGDLKVVGEMGVAMKMPPLFAKASN